ncbi:MAG: hypothetical protein Q8P12_06895, partial [bacterium]|nr:hypothetical protein [bacterium]
LGSTTIRDQIKWHVSLLNPQDMGQVLNNPNSWIQIEVVYRVSSGEDYTLSTGELVKVATLKESVNNHMTRQNGDMLLQPEMGGDSIDNDTYWLLASIMVPGGAPPGQQSQIGSMSIVCNDVRL